MIRCGAFLLSLSLGIAGIAGEMPEDFDNECTSWFVFSNLTKNQTNILHKNRDSGNRHIVPMINAADSPRRWIAIGSGGKNNKGGEEPCMGMNASGLAVAVNTGEVTTETGNDKGKMGTPNIVRDCLVNCDTAAQAVERVKLHIKSRQYRHGNRGSIFLFMDTKEACIVEMTGARTSVTHYNRSFSCRANIWHTGDLAETTITTPRGWLHSAGREYMVIRDLNRAFRANGKITVQDMLTMARDAEMPKDFPDYFTLCNRTTNSAATFEINLKYPDVLSAGYFFIGPTRHTICVPVPVCVKEYLPSMLNEKWTGVSWKRFDKLGFNGAVPPEYPAFEKQALVQYKAAQCEAEKLLVSGKRDEAIELLNKTARAIWLEAEKIIKPQP